MSTISPHLGLTLDTTNDVVNVADLAGNFSIIDGITINGVAIAANMTLTIAQIGGGTIPGNLTVTGTITGALTGNVTGNVTGTAASLSASSVLPNGTTATTQSASDNSTKVATTAYIDGGGFVKGGANSSITSLSGLSTPLSTGQGGTGATANSNAANGVIILNGSTQIPALSGALLTNVINSILNYGTSASSSSAVSLANLKLCFGNATVSGTSLAITNLPYTSSTSYTAVGIVNYGSGLSISLNANITSASSVTFYSTSSGISFYWFTIGY